MVGTRKTATKTTVAKRVVSRGLDGEKIGEPYIKIGRLKQGVAKSSGLKCADIYVSKNQITHIVNRHKNELDNIGFSPLNFLKAIVACYNQIRKGSDNSYLLVVYNGDDAINHYVAAISINYLVKEGFWEIKTAQPRRTKEIIRKERIW